MRKFFSSFSAPLSILQNRAEQVLEPRRAANGSWKGKQIEGFEIMEDRKDGGKE